MKRFILFFILFSAKNAYAYECPAGFFPVQSHPRNAYQKADGTSVSATHVKEQCRPYRVPKKLIPQFISTKPKEWPNSSERFKAWTKDEESKIQIILQKLPKALTQIGEVKFYRSTLKSPNPSVSNSENQIIVLYDSLSAHDLSRVISHELAHIAWDLLDNNLKKGFYDAAGWIISSNQKTISLQRKDVPIIDSYTGPHEDFANSLELFLHDRKLFHNNPKLFKCLESFTQ